MKNAFNIIFLFLLSFVFANAQCIKGDCNNGYGVFVNEQGQYEGRFTNSKLNGKGNLKMKDGSIYNGNFTNNLFNGKGVVKYSNGDRYKGYWKSGMKNGKGILSYNNGWKYIGDFMNDLRHGEGEMRNPKDKVISKGIWINDQLPNDKSSFLEMVERLEKSIVFIYNADDGEINGLGTGFVIGNRYVATNEHVVAGDFYILRMHDEIVYSKVEKVYTDLNLDLSILKIHDNIPFDYEALVFADQMPEKGEDVFAIGNPKGYDFTLSKGIISSFRSDASNKSMIQTTAAASSGSSGSPLFDENGKVIGIITLKNHDGDNLNFAYDLLGRKKFLSKFN